VSVDAIVIGGGFAGLSAATRLAERGRHVLVLEARPALGGRASAFVDPGTGERVDNGQHVFFGCYRETFRFLGRIGSEGGLHLQPRLSIGIVDPEGRFSRLMCPALPSPFHLLAGVMRWRALAMRDRWSVLRSRSILAAGGEGRDAAADGVDRRETVHAWLIRHGQSPRLVRLLWEPLAVAALNQSIHTASARAFRQVLHGLFGPDPRDSALAIARTPLDQLYAEPARRYVEARGGEVRLQCLARVECGGTLRVVTQDGRAYQASRVVCAVPWHALGDVFPERPAALSQILDAAARTDSSPIVTVNLWLDRPVTEEPFVGLPGRSMQWLFDKRALFGGDASHLSLISSGADALVGLSNAELVALARSELTAALPAAREATVRRAVVVRERRATFSVAPDQPPRPATKTRIPGLFLAGDWIETGLPATIEGAVSSGHAAAEAALEP
jgi:squalene-associated FAD-dependent desaturase